MVQAILLAGDPVIFERLAAAAITPGHLVEIATGGDAGKIKKHATAGGNAAAWFADTDPTPSRTATTDPLDTPYATSETVRVLACSNGDEIYAWIPASAAAIVEGDPLESNGDGTLRKHTAPSQAVNESGSATYTIAQYVNAIVAVAAEAKDNSGGGSAVRLRVRVI